MIKKEIVFSISYLSKLPIKDFAANYNFQFRHRAHQIVLDLSYIY